MDIVADAGEALEIAVDHRLRLVGLHAQPAAQSPPADAIEYREVDCLGAAAGVAVDGAEHLQRGAGMDILARGKSLLEARHIGDMRGEAQFDLAVVRGEDDVTGLGDETIADLAANL